MKKTLLALALPFAFATAAHAQTASSRTDEPFRFMVGIGLTVGGDNVATVQYQDNSTNNVSAGTGIQLMMGADYRIAEHFSMQASVGYHGRFALGSNGDTSFTRYPIELLAYYNVNEKWRIGGGVQYISKPSLSGSGVAARYDQDYQNTTGAIFEVEYFPIDRLGVKFRAVKETFKPTAPYNYNVNNPGQSIDGSHVGILSNYYF
jgi:opacity protein-like surface antigen